MGFVGNNYNPLIWEDLTMEEKKTYALYEAFQKEYNKMVREGKKPERFWLTSASRKSCYDYDRDGKYPADVIREHKFWHCFQEAYDKYKDFDAFDPSIFVQAVFYYRDPKKQIYPSILTTKDAEESYYQYMERLINMAKSDGTADRVLEGLKGTRKIMWKMMGLESSAEPEYKKIYSFFADIQKDCIVSKGIVYCMHGMISPYYMAVSRSFNSVFDDLDPDIKAEIGFDSKKDMEPYIGIMHQFPNVYKAAKLLFGEDIL